MHCVKSAYSFFWQFRYSDVPLVYIAYDQFFKIEYFWRHTELRRPKLVGIFAVLKHFITV